MLFTFIKLISMIRKNVFISLCLFISLVICIRAKAQQNLNPVIEKKVDALLKKMTLEEKVGQMAQVAIDVFVDAKGNKNLLDTNKLYDAEVKYKIGSILNTPSGKLLNAQQWNDAVATMQDEAKKTRLKIPVLYGLDDIHGVSYVADATLFPQEIGQAATWNRKIVHDIGVITAYEGRAAGVPWTFSPVLDLGTNPLWPRIWEGYGEDPYLISEMGIQFVKAVQEPLGNKEKLIVSLKHYMAYSDPKSGKDRTDAWIPENYLREYHLPPFEEAVKAGARTVMVNSGLINGIPTHINKYILTDILKKELGFTGFIVTDWQDIENIYRRDKMANNMKGATMLAINAGIDMSMIPYNYKEFCTDLVALVKEGKVSQVRIDDAVKRILRVKFETGIFETPVTYLKDYPKFGSAGFQKTSYEAASESITLLKNSNNTLPLHQNAKVLVTGPNANSMRPLNGGWTYTWQGERTDEFTSGKYHTILEAVRKKLGASNVLFEEAVAYNMKGNYFEDSIVNIASAVQAAANVDYILLCIGENSYTETPGNTNDLSLSENQIALVNALIKTGKPVILILNEGRPRIISRIEPGAAAILDIYLPGNFGADALADILSGDVNPSGKLPMTYPRYVNDLVGYIHKPSEGSGNPQGGETNPQYPFGFGLSYSNFSYRHLSINKKIFDAGETAAISITVTNNGNKEGKEVVELFISDLIASLTPDVKRLRGFEKINLQPGESKTVSFNVPVKQLAFVGLDNKKHLEQGEFKIQIADQTTTFSINKTVIF